MWRYFADGRTYQDTIVVASEDAAFDANDTVLYSSVSDSKYAYGLLSNEKLANPDVKYAETSEGKTFEAKEQKARYIRIYTRGSILTSGTAHGGNHICEVEVYGKAIKNTTTQKKITVAFDTKGGNSIESLKVAAGESWSLPQNPTRAGYVFKGWYSDVNCTVAYTAASPVSADLTLFAKWEEDPTTNVQLEEAKAVLNSKIAEVKDIIIEETQKTVRTNEGDFYAKNIIISTGASHRKLGVPGERELAGMGVSYCATCDGAFFKGRTVAVVGGGDVAVGDALFLARGCKKVYLIHRRDELRAAKSLQKKLMALPNVEIIWDTVVNEICGEDQVEALFIENKKTGAKKHLPVDGVFVAVGMKPNTNMVPDEIKKDEAGYIVADENCVTNVTGIFAAGDVRTKMLRQIITAAADGANAVESVQHGI